MIRNWSTALAHRVRGCKAHPRGTAAPVTYGLIVLCCLLFLVSPAAGVNPAYGSGDGLLAAQRACPGTGG
ncbi:hypothetical protein SFUMM280S_08584 [Streptomyces fumanus]